MSYNLRLGRCATAIISVFWLCAFWGFNVSAQQPPGPPPTQMAPPANFAPIQKKGDGIYRLDQIEINKLEKSITFPAQVNMDKGLLEYVLVKSTGKIHESLLRTEVEPYYLNVAFLLLGFEGTTHPLSEQGVNEQPTGQPVKVELLYEKDGKTISLTPERWIVKKINGKDKAVSRLNWVYTGSVIMQDQFLAQISGSIIALFHDPEALLDNTDPAGSNDEVWFVNEKEVPQLGTNVMVKISSIIK